MVSLNAQISFLLRSEWGQKGKNHVFGKLLQLPIFLALRSNSSEDKSGMWVGSTKKYWNLTSSMKMSPFRVKYGYNIMKNNTHINLWWVLYIYGTMVLRRYASIVLIGCYVKLDTYLTDVIWLNALFLTKLY